MMPKRQHSFKAKKQEESIHYLRPGPLLHWQSRSSPRIASPPVAQYNKRFNTRTPVVKHRRQPPPLHFQHTILEEMDTSLSSAASSSYAASTPSSTTTASNYTHSNNSSKRSSWEQTNNVMFKTANISQQSTMRVKAVHIHPQAGGFFDEGDEMISSLAFNDDSDTDDIDLLGHSQDDSMLMLSFPLPPPITAPRMLHHARSLNNLSRKLHEEQQGQHPAPLSRHHSTHSPQRQYTTQQQIPSIQPSPLRERRCKQPLTIKAPSSSSTSSAAATASTMKLRRVKSSSSGFFSPPPCPPPTSPLPELPLSSCGEVRQNKSPLLFLQQQQQQQQQPVQLQQQTWQWSSQSSQKSDFDSPPSLSSPCFSSSPSTSPASSRGSSHRRSDSKPISATIATSTTTKHAKNSIDWDEQLSAKLGLAFALHLNLTSTTGTQESNKTTIFQQQSTPFYQGDMIDDDQTNHVYGFAL